MPLLSQRGQREAGTFLMYSKEYENYLLSGHWRGLRESALNRANRRCEACPETKGLHGHHLKYRSRLEDCTEEDIMALCERCHDLWHTWLRKHNRRVDEFCRYSTRGAIQVLLTVPIERRAIYPSLRPTKQKAAKVKVKNKAALLRERMSVDERILRLIQTCENRKRFKKSVRSLALGYPGCSGSSSFMTNVLMVYRQRRKR